MNAEGQVIGMIQKNNDPESKESYAIGIRYLNDLNITALSVNDLTLNSIGIKKDCPKMNRKHWFTFIWHPALMTTINIWNC